MTKKTHRWNSARFRSIASGDNGEAELFWRPGMSAAVQITDNRGQQNDSADVRLAFFGTKPRIAFAGALDDHYFDDYDHSLWSITSPDNGVTWSAPVNIPSGLGTTLDVPITLAIGSRGQAAIATDDNGGNGTDNCTQPKLAMSPDWVNWTTCGPNADDGSILLAAGSSQVAFASNDTLFLGFQQTTTGDNALPLGVTLWRQPPNRSFPPPPPPQN